MLNNHAYVSPKTRVIVEKAIKNLNYKPNMLGRNLRRSSTQMILLFLPTISNAFYTKVLEGVEDTARKNNYYILLCETNGNPDIQRFYLNMAKQHLVDGIISMDPSAEDIILNETDQHIPIVQCGEKTNDDRIPYVGIDNVAAGYKATKYLLSIGRDRISFISSSKTYNYDIDRKLGYQQALEEANIPFDPELIEYSDLDFDAGYQTMKNILANNKGINAVFTVGDMIAIGALKAIKDSGLTCPNDIAVVGVDNIPFASMMNPTLTTISQPSYEMGSNAVRMLLNKLNNPELEVKSILLPHELIIRDSTMV